MTDDIQHALDRMTIAYRAGRTLLLLFDYDGTLVPIVEHPRLAVLADETREVLRYLADLPRVVVGIVSGRSLDDVKRMVELSGLCYVGTSGLECELGGTRSAHGNTLEVRERLAQVAERLREIARSFPGAWVEQKPLALTFHFRGVAVARRSELYAQASSILISFDGQLRVTDGPLAMEITPDLGWNKGSAVQWLCEQIGVEVTPVYAGDHMNDRDALATTTALGGVSIGVGPDSPTTHQHRVADPGALIKLLQRLSVSLASCR